MTTQSIVSQSPTQCQTEPTCDAATALRDAAAFRHAERARQCRARAWGITFIIDVCDDAATVATWLAERDALVAEATRLEGGAA